MISFSNYEKIFLSDKEISIVKLLSEGCSAKEIARSLELSPRTVERYIENIRLKMHSRNSVQMVATVIASGLLDEDGDEVLPLFDAN